MTAANVISLGSRFACPVCGITASWRVVGRTEVRACRDHLGEVAEQVESDGFQPLTLIPVFQAGDVA